MPSRSPERPTRHVRRVFAVVLAAGVLFFVVQRLVRPDTFGRFGNYRAAALTTLMQPEPVHLGKEACASCHEEVYETHAKDFHFDVECEDCHTPGREHAEYHRSEDPPEGAAAELLPKEYTREGCLFCHRELNARPRSFAQITPEEHYEFLGVNDPQTQCIQCHSPHEPIFVLTEVAEARMHPVIHECVDCHEEEPEDDFRTIESHPTMFVCGDCHDEVVADFESRNHSFMRCTACHLYHPENEDAGRIMKNGNQRFCLLCHEDEPFREGARQPLIDSAEHLGMVAEALDMDVEELRADPRTCLNCHSDVIHGDLEAR